VLLAPLTPSERPDVIALNDRHAHLTAPMDDARLGYLTDVGTVEVIRHEDRFAGFVVTMAGDAAYDSGNFGWFAERYDAFGYLDRIVIHEDFRRRGLAGLVYDEVEDRVAQRAPLLALDVNSDPPNVESLAFHARRGYQQVGERDFHDHRVALLVKQLR
jgi:uncharacterized protein